jgi:hypothetical protein
MSLKQTASLPSSCFSDPAQVGHFCVTVKPTASPTADDPSDKRFGAGCCRSLSARAAHLWQNRQWQSGHHDLISNGSSGTLHVKQK